MDISPAGIAHLFLFLVFVPWLVVKSKRALDAGHAMPPTLKSMRSTIVLQLIFIVIGLMVVRVEWLDVFPERLPTATDVLLALAVLAGITATIPLRWRMTGPAARQRMAHTMPQRPDEFALWVPISLCAGFGEELNYRGILVILLHAILGNRWLAVAISALAFGLGHATQGWRKVGWVLLFTAGMQWLCDTTGTLYLAMAVHAVYDILAGIVFGRLTRGLRSPAPHAAAA